MKNRVRKLAVAVARQFRQTLDQDVGFTDHDFGNHPVPKVREQFLVALEKPAVQQGKNRLRVIGIKFGEFRNNSRRRVAFQSNLVHPLREPLDCVLEFFRRFSRCRQENEIDVRIGKERLPAKISNGGEHNLGGSKTRGIDELRP